jgi:hypothetical protein
VDRNEFGPRRLDMEQALDSAIHKVSSVHGCYNTDFDWSNLHVLTWCWPGEYKQANSE